MTFKRVLENKKIRGVLIGFVLLSMVMPGALTACTNSRSMKSYLKQNNIQMSEHELAGIVNDVMSYPDLVILSGVEGEDDIGYEMTQSTEFEGYQYLTYKIDSVAGTQVVSAKSKTVKPKVTSKSKVTPKPTPKVTPVLNTTNIKDAQGKTVTVMTRAGFIRNLALLLNGKNPVPATKDWEITKAINEKWLPRTYTKSEFDSPITREEIGYITVKALKLKPVENYSYADVLNSPYKSEIMTALSNAILIGPSDKDNLGVKNIPDLKETEGILNRIKNACC